MQVLDNQTQAPLEDALLPSVNEAIKLPVFEGPMDLLIFLIKKNEINIYDIPIETVTRQYLKIIYDMEKMDLDVAGEFFVMASTLMYIKSRMLLPKVIRDTTKDEPEEEADPRWELVSQLIQYKKIKETALGLDDLIINKQHFVSRDVLPEVAPREERPLKPSDKMDVWNAYNALLRRLSDKILYGEIHDEQVTVAERMEVILEKVKASKTFMFSSIFPENPTINMVIASFLAMLELCRLRQVSLEQDEAFEDIRCSPWQDSEKILDED